MKHLMAFFASVGLALSPSFSFAGGVVLGGSTGSGTTKTSSSGLAGSSYTAAADTAVTTPKVDAMVTNAKDAAKQQNKGMNMALITAGIMAGVAAATCPSCGHRGTCGVCAASLVGAAAAGLTAGQMSQAKGISNQQAYDVNPVDVPNPATEAKADAGKLNLANKQIQDATKGTGFKVSDDMSTVTTPDGRNLSVPNAFSPGGGGLSAGEQAALSTELKKAQAQAADKVGKDGNIASEIIEEFGGGGSRSTASRATPDDPTAAAKAGTGARSPSAVAGAFKEYNGEKIGVAMDSVFDMLHRRYKHHAEDRKSLNMQ